MHKDNFNYQIINDKQYLDLKLEENSQKRSLSLEPYRLYHEDFNSKQYKPQTVRIIIDAWLALRFCSLVCERLTKIYLEIEWFITCFKASI